MASAVEEVRDATVARSDSCEARRERPARKPDPPALWWPERRYEGKPEDDPLREDGAVPRPAAMLSQLAELDTDARRERAAAAVIGRSSADETLETEDRRDLLDGTRVWAGNLAARPSDGGGGGGCSGTGFCAEATRVGPFSEIALRCVCSSQGAEREPDAPPRLAPLVLDSPCTSGWPPSDGDDASAERGPPPSLVLRRPPPAPPLLGRPSASITSAPAERCCRCGGPP